MQTENIPRGFNADKFKVGVFWLVLGILSVLLSAWINPESEIVVGVLFFVCIGFLVVGVSNLYDSNRYWEYKRRKKNEHTKAIEGQKEFVEKNQEITKKIKKIQKIIKQNDFPKHQYTTGKIGKILIFPTIFALIGAVIWVFGLDEGDDVYNILKIFVVSVFLAEYVIHIFHERLRLQILAEKINASPEEGAGVSVVTDSGKISIEEYSASSEWRYRLYQLIKAYMWLITIAGSLILIVVLFAMLGAISIAPSTVIIILLVLILLKR